MSSLRFSAISCIARLETCTTIDELKSAFQNEIETLGFSSFLLFSNAKRKAVFGALRLYTSDEEWTQSYIAPSRVKDDPVTVMAQTRQHPFMFAEADEAPGLSTSQREIIAHRKQHKPEDGVCFPVHGVSGYETHVLCWRHGPALSNALLANVHLAVIYLVNRLAQITETATREGEALSMREREILTWTALGRTAPEIAATLGISRATVHTHIKNSIRKLSARNKIDAVTAAIRQGIIKL